MAKNNSLKVIGISCAVLLILGVVVALALGLLAKKTFDESLGNPEENAIRILNYETLPKGYFVNFAMSIPFVADAVMLSDTPNLNNEPNIEDANYGFFYTKVKLAEEQDIEGLNDFFTGKTDDTSVLGRNHINVDLDSDEILKRGMLVVDGLEVSYLVSRDGMSTEEFSSKGLSTIMLVRCEDRKMRFGIWFSNEIMPAGEEELNLTGSVGDEAKIRAFLSHFKFCGSAS